MRYYRDPGNQSSVNQSTLIFFKDFCYRLKPYFFSIEHTVSKIYALKTRQKYRNNRWLDKQIQGMKDHIRNKKSQPLIQHIALWKTVCWIFWMLFTNLLPAKRKYIHLTYAHLWVSNFTSYILFSGWCHVSVNDKLLIFVVISTLYVFGAGIWVQVNET